MLADAVLVLHFAIVLFVVGGLIVVVVGNLRHWRWVNRRCFRYAHIAAIAFVVLQAWLGQMCPLTTLESWLRVQSGGQAYERSFIESWIAPVLFHQAPAWAFTLAYSVFGLLVAAAWWRFPPERPARSATRDRAG